MTGQRHALRAAWGIFGDHQDGTTGSTARGPNSTEMVQLVSGRTGDREQVSSTILKSSVFAPSRLTRVTWRGAVPTLVT